MSDKTADMSIEDKESVVIRKLLNAMCLFNAIADRLYPDEPIARRREERLREEGGDLIRRLEDTIRTEMATCNRWLAKNATTLLQLGVAEGQLTMLRDQVGRA